MMKTTELRALSAVELEKKVADLKKDLFNLRLQHAMNQLENTNKIGETKREIARVNTVLRELALAGK